MMKHFYMIEDIEAEFEGSQSLLPTQPFRQLNELTNAGGCQSIS